MERHREQSVESRNTRQLSDIFIIKKQKITNSRQARAMECSPVSNNKAKPKMIQGQRDDSAAKVTHLATKPEDLSAIPEPCRVEGTDNPLILSSDL